MKGSIGQEEGLTVEPDQAVVAESSHGAFDRFLVADLPPHFEHRPVKRVAAKHKGQDRPLRGLVFDWPTPNTLCLHRNSVSGASRGVVSATPPAFDLLDETKLEQEIARI
jgi:hypothetical protein